MSDSKDNETKTPLTLSQPGRLELKKTVGSGQVRQTFSHGRSKTVAVEKKTTRRFAAGAGGTMHEVGSAPTPAPVVPAAPVAPISHDADLSHLTDHEREARLRALAAARLAEEEAARQALKDQEEAARLAAQQKAEEAARPAPEPVAEVEAAAPVNKADEPRPVAAAAESVTPEVSQPAPVKPVTISHDAKDEEDAPAPARPAHQGPRMTAPPSATPPVRSRARDDEEDDRNHKRAAAHKAAPAKRNDQQQRRRTGKLTVNAALEDDDRGERGRSLAAMRRARERERLKAAQGLQEKIVREVIIPETITVQELANRMAARGGDVIKSLMKMGVMATITQSIDADTAELVVSEFGHTPKRVSDADVLVGLEGIEDTQTDLVARPPVVTVMGHVDHGKTSLLDALRATDVVSGEAGGITQHIGAYQVTLKSGDKITFIDTPGHEAFTAMRARGASVTDVVVLVVAADDGIMPQTVEAIRHARAANVPIIVAINKIDKPDADPNRVRQELLQHELVTEDLGGDVLTVEVSAKKRMNLDKLEEIILLQSEILDLKANPDRAAQGTVVEARMEKGRGPVATVLVQRGTLRVGDVFVAGAESGKVRALIDDKGNRVEEAGPSTPVEILGLDGVPAAGDDFIAVSDEARAREIAGYRQRKDREARAKLAERGTLEQMFSAIQAGEAKELSVVIKGDVQGSVEAITNTLAKIGNDNVKVRVLHAAVGAINESDVTLAKASSGLIIGFNVRANPQARDMARRDGVDIRYYSIIYDVTDDLKQMLSGMLAPTLREKFLGYAEIREVFSITKVGKVAGCMVTEGQVKRGAKVRLLRDNVVIHEGDLSQLKRFKDDVKDVREGYECGMSFANYDDIRVKDVIECFEVEEIAGVL